MAKITVIGLGAGDLNQMTLGTYEKVMNSHHIYVRTNQHPVVQQLQEKGLKVTSFDSYYEKGEEFSKVYEEITSYLIDQVKEGKSLMYATPGHPFVAEQTTQLLLEAGKKYDVEVDVIGGQSFLDPMFSTLQIDPVDGFALLDALTLDKRLLNPHLHLIITQIYDDLTASDVKLTLMDVYPDDYEIILVIAAGISGQEQIQKMPLYELDHWQEVSNLAAVYVPPSTDKFILNREFSTLREIIAVLRGPNGCPWDRKQTHQSLRKHLIEETYEAIEAIDHDDPESMCEEMGDVLLQVMLHARIAEEDALFTIEDIISGLNEKLLRRHPHVFGEKKAQTDEEALSHWNQIKLEEKRAKGINEQSKSLLDGIPRELPSLMTANELAKKAARAGFDWTHIEDVYAKIKEEMNEVKEAQSLTHIQEEIGDLLFTVVNLARFLKIDAEEALSQTNQKFKKRFQFIEQKLDKPIGEATLEEMEALWQRSKQK